MYAVSFVQFESVINRILVKFLEMSARPSLSDKNRLKDENRKRTMGCGSRMRLSWRGGLRVSGKGKGRYVKKDAFRRGAYAARGYYCKYSASKDVYRPSM